MHRCLGSLFCLLTGSVFALSDLSTEWKGFQHDLKTSRKLSLDQMAESLFQHSVHFENLLELKSDECQKVKRSKTKFTNCQNEMKNWRQSGLNLFLKLRLKFLAELLEKQKSDLQVAHELKTKN